MEKNEGTDLKFRLLVASGVFIVVICVFLIIFYTHIDVKTASAEEDKYSCGYIPYLDAFLYIDMNGKVLSITSQATPNLPVIEGLQFNHFAVGGYLNSENNNALSDIAQLTKLFNKHELGGVLSKIDIEDTNNIHLYTKNIYVTFGSTDHADEKIRILKEVIANLRVAEDVKGLLDISVIGRQYIFKILT